MADVVAQKIARAFSRLGWIGFGTQLVLAIIPIFMLCYALFRKVSDEGTSFDLSDYIAVFGLTILLFTTMWSYRYTLLAKRIADPARRPSRDKVSRVLWVGIWAGCLGIVISLLLLFFEVIRLVFLFMMAPQAGVPVIQTQTDNRTQWVSAIDAVSLLAELCTLTGELLVLGLSLWLLFKITRAGDTYDQSTALGQA